MNWTGADGIKRAAARLWDGGKLPAALLEGGTGELFPYYIKIHGPSASELPGALNEARLWRERLEGSPYYSLEYKTVKPRLLAPQPVPCRAVIHSAEAALALAGKTGEAARLSALGAETKARLPELYGWLARNPWKALAAYEDWGFVLSFCEWMRSHPDPGVFLRETGIPGIDTKFVETGRKPLLCELLDILLPSRAAAAGVPPAASFEARYGFKLKPRTVRIRPPVGPGPFPPQITDLSVTVEELDSLEIPCREVLVVENLATFLSLKRTGTTLLVWGCGKAAALLSKISWLGGRRLLYWGDADTEGFEILANFRKAFPHAESLFMDGRTLTEYRYLCVVAAATGRPDRGALTADELEALDALDLGGGRALRLEQERVPYGRVEETLAETIH